MDSVTLYCDGSEDTQRRVRGSISGKVCQMLSQIAKWPRKKLISKGTLSQIMDHLETQFYLFAAEGESQSGREVPGSTRLGPSDARRWDCQATSPGREGYSRTRQIANNGQPVLGRTEDLGVG